MMKYRIDACNFELKQSLFSSSFWVSIHVALKVSTVMSAFKQPFFPGQATVSRALFSGQNFTLMI